MNDEIKDILIVIAKKLNNKYKVLNHADYEEFLINIDIYSFNDLCRFACMFLNLSIFFKSVYSGLKGEFEKIYKILLDESGFERVNANYKTVDFVREYFERANYITLLDGHFDNYELGEGLKCYRFKIGIPIEQLEIVLEEFYELGAEVYEGTTKQDLANINCDAIVSFNGLTFEIRTYMKQKEDMIETEKYFKTFNGLMHETIQLSPNMVKDCFETSKGSTLIETPEFMFIDAITGGTAFDYIEAMILKNRINLKKISFIKSRINRDVEMESEEKQNGFQKTC